MTDEMDKLIEDYNKGNKSINRILVVTGDDLPMIYARAYLNGDRLVIAIDSSKKDPNDTYGIPALSKFLTEAESIKK